MKPKIIHGASMYIYIRACMFILCRYVLDSIFYIVKYYIIVSLDEKEKKKKLFTEATIPQEILSACEYYEYTEYCNKITS